MFAFQRALTLFFQFQTIFECFTNTLRHLVIPMSVRIKGDGVYQRHIKLAVFHNAFIRSDIDDLSNHSTAIFAILIFNKFTFETKWELVDNRGVYHLGFADGKAAAGKLVGSPVPGFHAEIIRFYHVSGIGYTDSKGAACLNIFHSFMGFG